MQGQGSYNILLLNFAIYLILRFCLFCLVQNLVCHGKCPLMFVLTRLFTFAINTRYIFYVFLLQSGETTTTPSKVPAPYLSMSMFQLVHI